MSSTYKISLSPTAIADFFTYQCQRQLILKRRVSFDQNTSEQEVSKMIHQTDSEDESNLAEEYYLKQLQEKGYAWEAKAIEPLGEKVYKPINEKERLSSEETLNWLKNPTFDKPYIYQSTLSLPDQFYETYKIDKEAFTFKNCHPDLLWKEQVNGQTIVNVIDLKTSRVIYERQKIQIVVYVLILQAIIDAENLGEQIKINLENGYVWLPQDQDKHHFSIRAISPHVSYFLKTTLKEMTHLLKEPEQADWVLGQSCENCSFFKSKCLPEAENNNPSFAPENYSIMLLPYMTKRAIQILKDEGIHTLIELKQAIDDLRLEKLMKNSYFMQRERTRLQKKLAAQLSQQKEQLNLVGIGMPSKQNVAVILTAQRDPVFNEIFAAGISIYTSHNSQEDTHFFFAKSSTNFSEIRREFISKLYEILCEAETKKQTVQTYVFDNYEWQNIESMFQSVLIDSGATCELKNQVWQLMMHYHQLRSFQNTEHPNEIASKPVVVLTSLISSIYALPAKLTYRISDIDKAFTDNPVYVPEPDTTYQISNAMHAKLAHLYWQQKNQDHFDTISNEVKKRLATARRVIFSLQELVSSKKLASQFELEPFVFPVRREYNEPIFSKLDFMTQYEFQLTYEEIRRKRSLAEEERIEKMYSIFRKVL